MGLLKDLNEVICVKCLKLGLHMVSLSNCWRLFFVIPGEVLFIFLTLYPSVLITQKECELRQ